MKIRIAELKFLSTLVGDRPEKKQHICTVRFYFFSALRVNSFKLCMVLMYRLFEIFSYVITFLSCENTSLKIHGKLRPN